MQEQFSKSLQNLAFLAVRSVSSPCCSYDPYFQCRLNITNTSFCFSRATLCLDHQLFLRPLWLCLVSRFCLVNVEIPFPRCLSRKRRDIPFPVIFFIAIGEMLRPYLIENAASPRSKDQSHNSAQDFTKCNSYFKPTITKIGPRRPILVTTLGIKFHENSSGATHGHRGHRR